MQNLGGCNLHPSTTRRKHTSLPLVQESSFFLAVKVSFTAWISLARTHATHTHTKEKKDRRGRKERRKKEIKVNRNTHPGCRHRLTNNQGHLYRSRCSMQLFHGGRERTEEHMHKRTPSATHLAKSQFSNLHSNK